MAFQIRESITSSVAGSDATEIYNMVGDAIKKGDEHFLPGLGVFFEKWWQSADPQTKQNVAEKLQHTFRN